MPDFWRDENGHDDTAIRRLRELERRKSINDDRRKRPDVWRGWIPPWPEEDDE